MLDWVVYKEVEWGSSFGPLGDRLSVDKWGLSGHRCIFACMVFVCLQLRIYIFCPFFRLKIHSEARFLFVFLPSALAGHDDTLHYLFRLLFFFFFFFIERSLQDFGCHLHVQMCWMVACGFTVSRGG